MLFGQLLLVQSRMNVIVTKTLFKKIICKCQENKKNVFRINGVISNATSTNVTLTVIESVNRRKVVR